MQRFRLRGAHPTLGQFLYTTPYNTTETLTLVMRDDDLLEVQALSDLAVDAKSVWLVAEEGLARAVSDNDRSAAITKPLEVDTYVPDTLQSEMELYTIDMHEGLDLLQVFGARRSFLPGPVGSHSPDGRECVRC